MPLLKSKPTVEDKLWTQRIEREVYAQTRPVYEKYYKGKEHYHRPSFSDSQDSAQELINGFKRVKSSPSLAGSEAPGSQAANHVVLPRRDSKSSYLTGAPSSCAGASVARALSGCGSVAGSQHAKPKSTRGGGGSSTASTSKILGSQTSAQLRQSVQNLVKEEVQKLLEPIQEEISLERDLRKKAESELESLSGKL
ncbi:unnamed protein product [Amoebophrya sp. A120]|nr:unnamed protein product [Amoebophrya sp. A120]|eukprot:GSA120T00004073001.1